MKRLLFCLVALIAVFALVMPTYAAEVKISGLWNAKAYARDNYDGDDDTDDSVQYITQRMRMYFNIIASENLKLVYKNEIDFEYGDGGDYKVTDTNGNTQTVYANRNDGGGLGGDRVNLETKNVYLEFMVPDTPVKATIGLQGVALHRGWFIDDDVAATRFDMNFDPVVVTAYWAGASGLFDNNQGPGEDTDASDDVWHLVASGAYKAENMDARLTFGYQKGPNDTTTAEVPESDDLYLVMGEFNMNLDMVSFFVILGKNFGEVKSDGAGDRNYDGYMAHVGANFALDMATLRAQFIYTSGDKEGDLDDDFQGFAGETFSWAEMISDGWSYDRNCDMGQIGGDNSPSNMWAVGVGATVKPTDTMAIIMDIYYIGMVEDRTVGGDKEDTIGTEIDVRLTQKIYDNLTLSVAGAYMIADDGFGQGGTAGNWAPQSAGDDAYQLGIGLDFSY
jgi:hypothetical protein